MPGLGVQPNLLSAAKLPPRLLERMNELREDEGARGDLERRVESGRRATRRRAEMAHSSAKASKRQQLMQQLFTAHAPPAPPPPPRHDAGTHDDPPGSPQRRPPVAGRRSIQRRGSIEYASMIGLDEHGIARPDVEQAERETPAPPPPLPPKQAMPWAHDAVERARGDRTRDPLECGDSAQSVVRRREKGLELGGVFRYAVQSDTQRLAALAETIEPLDQPAPNLGAALAGLPVTRPGAAAALWKGGDFLNTRPSASPIADAVMLHGHRLPFIDAHRREALIHRRRDRAAELGARPLHLKRKHGRRAAASEGGEGGDGADSSAAGDSGGAFGGLYSHIKQGSQSARAAASSSLAGGVDEIEMATARLLLSTSLSIHRKHHVTAGTRSPPPKLR